MKTFYAKLSLCFLFGGTAIFISSCGEDKKDDINEVINNIDKPVEDDPVMGNLTATEQKKKIDEAGTKFLDQISAADFSYFSKLAEYVDDELEDYDDEALSKWVDDLLDQMSVKTGTSEESYGGYSYVDTYYYTNYTQLILLSNFVGHFSAENRQWTYTKASDLQFSFKDQEGKNVTLTVKTSGNYKDVHFGEDEEWDDYEYYRNGNKTYYDYYYNVYDRTVRVPSKIEATLKQGGTVKSELVLNIDLSDMKSADYNLATDAYSANAMLTIGDYKLNNTKTAYNGKTNAEIKASFAKGGKSLIAFSISAEGNYQQETVKKVNVGIDIMEAIQIKGAVENGRDFVEYVSKAEENDENESKFKSNISLANDLLNLGVYYDGRSERQASIKLECFHERDRWNDYWYSEPVFYFGDESSYTAFDVFFETGFDKLIAKYEKILDDFERLF